MTTLYQPNSYFLRRIGKGTRNSSPSYQPKVLQRLLDLMDDHDDANRDWATFFIANSEHVSADIDDALLANAYDSHIDVSAEATIGLARRLHPKAFVLISRALDKNAIGRLDIEAAGTIANRLLLPKLKRISKWWTLDEQLLERAIRSCSTGKPDEYGFSGFFR